MQSRFYLLFTLFLHKKKQCGMIQDSARVCITEISGTVGPHTIYPTKQQHSVIFEPSP